MDFTEFKEKIKAQGPDVHIQKNTNAEIVLNRPDIPINADPPKKDGYIDLKIYYDKENDVYKYSEDSHTWTTLNEDQLANIFFNSIKPFVV